MMLDQKWKAQKLKLEAEATVERKKRRILLCLIILCPLTLVCHHLMFLSNHHPRNIDIL